MNTLTPALARFLLAVLVLALFGGSIIVMSFFSVPGENRDAVIQLVGGVNMLAGIVIGYYFRQPGRQEGGQ